MQRRTILAWAAGSVAAVALTPAQAQVSDLSEVQSGVGRVFGTDPQPGDPASAAAEPKYGNVNTSGVVRLFYRSIDYPSNMGLAAKGSSGFTQDTEVKQAFDAVMRK